MTSCSLKHVFKRLMPLKIFHEIDPTKLSNFEKLDPMLMEMLDEIDSEIKS